MPSSVELTRKIRAPYGQSSGSVDPSWFGRTALAFDNDYQHHGAIKAGTDAKPVWGMAETNDVLIAGGKLNPRLTPIVYNLATATVIDDATAHRFHVHPTIPNLAQMRIEAITVSWETAESSASPTLNITKEESGQAPGAGVSLLSAGIDVTDTAATPNAGALVTDVAKLTLVAGDMLSVKLSTTTTELAGLNVTIWVSPGHIVNFASYVCLANGSLADAAYAVLNRPTTALAVSYVHATLGTNGSAVTAMPERPTSTENPSSGDAMMASGFNCKSTINVPQHGTLVTTAVIVRSAPQNRFAIDFTGTLTALAGVVMTMAYSAWEDAVEIQLFTLDTGAAITDRTLVNLVRDMAIVGAMCNFAVQAGGASNIQLQSVESGEAAGAGHVLLSLDSSQGFATDGTAETPEEGALVVTPSSHFAKATDRIGAAPSGTLTSLAGVSIGVLLAPR